MADRDRLIELMLNAPQIPCIKGGQATGKRYQTFQNIADYLLANGVIVPPCPIGAKIYMLVTRKTTSFEFPNGKMQRIENQHTFIKETYLTKSNFFKVLDAFGKTVFLTKEETEKALAKGAKNEKV